MREGFSKLDEDFSTFPLQQQNYLSRHNGWLTKPTAGSLQYMSTHLSGNLKYLNL